MAKPGDVGLGWDFKVRLRRVTYPTANRSNSARPRSERRSDTPANDQWRLVVIANVLSENLRLLALRNPFPEKSRSRYAFLGEGLRLTYQLW